MVLIRIPFFILSGFAFGSFANVYFFRISRNLSIVTPRSFCPDCNHPISWKDNIPLLSYILLKGRCRSCGSPISMRYPLVEAACCLLFTLITVRFIRQPLPAFVSILAFSYVLFLAAGIDLFTFLESGKEFGIIPDYLIWILAFLWILSLPFHPAFLGHWRSSLYGSAGGGLLMLAVRWVAGSIYKKEALGLADVKLVAASGLWLGWKGTAALLGIGSAAGALTGIFLLALRKVDDSRSPLPFAPFLVFGSLCALFFIH